MKIKKPIGILAAVLLCAVMIFSVTGCSTGQASSTSSTSSALESGDVKVWTASSDTKYLQTQTDAACDERELVYNVVKNEYESKQVVITAFADIKAYSFVTRDLKNGDNVFSSENIEVYMERFVLLNSGGDVTTYGGGYYPDALIPYELAKAAGELTVKADKNAILYITFYIPKETVAGAYTGNFSVVTDGITTNIPVTLNVYDYTLTDETTTKTSFTWRYNRVGSGEMDYTTEMYQTYYDFFQDYRITLQNPVVDVNTAEQFADAVEKDFDDMSCYTFMPYIGELGGVESAWSATKAQLLELARRSTAEKNLLEKAMFYFIDEPDLTSDSVIIDRTQRLKAHNQRLVATANEIAADSTGAYDDFKAIDNWREYIEDIPNIIPINLSPIIGRLDEQIVIDFLTEVNCLCPGYKSYYQTLSYMDILKEDFDIDIWWYGCINPVSPYSNYHIGNTNLLSCRSNTWLQVMYGVEGNLYWDAAAYTSYASLSYGDPVDVYTSPYRAVGTSSDLAGDGFLTYPGAKYGYYGPLPSLRLMAIRDGMEDSELLSDLKAKYLTLEDDYDVDADRMMEILCDSLHYGGTMLYSADQNYLDFEKLKVELFELLIGFDGNERFYIADVEEKNNYAEVTFYANSADYNVYFGSKLLTPVSTDLFKTSFRLSGSGFYSFYFENKTSGEKTKFTRYIGTAVDYLIDFDSLSESISESLTFTADGDGCFVNTDSAYRTSKKSLGVTVSSKITGNSLQDLLFVPGFSLSADIMNVDMSKLIYLSLDVYNANSDADSLTISIASGASIQEVTTIKLLYGCNTVTLPLNSVLFSKMDSVDRLVFTFENKGTTDNFYIHKIYIDNVYAVKEAD